jgi:hypothetical protein
MSWLYGLLGFGGLSFIVWVVMAIRRWGAEEARREKAEIEFFEAMNANRVLQAQRDAAARPPGTADDAAEWLSGR